MVDMSHRHVVIDEYAKNSRRLDWAHGVRTDLNVADWNVVATMGRCTPDILRLERVFSCSLLLVVHCDTSFIQSDMLSCSEMASRG